MEAIIPLAVELSVLIGITFQLYYSDWGTIIFVLSCENDKVTISFRKQQVGTNSSTCAK